MLTVSSECSSWMLTLQLSLLQQHLQVGVQLLPPLFNKVWGGVVVEQPLGRQLEPVSRHLRTDADPLLHYQWPDLRSQDEHTNLRTAQMGRQAALCHLSTNMHRQLCAEETPSMVRLCK